MPSRMPAYAHWLQAAITYRENISAEMEAVSVHLKTGHLQQIEAKTKIKLVVEKHNPC